MTSLPAEYVSYFAADRPKQGYLAVEPGWFHLWAPSEIERHNKNYEVRQRNPGFVAFGAACGCEILAFDPDHRVYVLTIVGGEKNARTLVADSWAEFARIIESSNTGEPPVRWPEPRRRK